MKPISYTTKDYNTTYHYTFSELRKFITLGKLHGDVGMILVKRNEVSKIITYKGFGTIDNPHTWIGTMSLKHFPQFDGKWRTNKDIIHPKPVKNELVDYKIVLLDMSDYSIKPNIQKLNG